MCAFSLFSATTWCFLYRVYDSQFALVVVFPRVLSRRRRLIVARAETIFFYFAGPSTEEKKWAFRVVLRASCRRKHEEVNNFKVALIAVSLASGNFRDTQTKFSTSPFTFPLQFRAHSGNCRTWTSFQSEQLRTDFLLFLSLSRLVGDKQPIKQLKAEKVAIKFIINFHSQLTVDLFVVLKRTANLWVVAKIAFKHS